MRYVDYGESRDIAMSREDLIRVVQNCLFSWSQPDANMDEGNLMEYYKNERKELLQLLKERL
jgi:20S proteasome alpha/beta subunit